MSHAAARRALIRTAALCAALALAPAHAIYKWMDEKGVTHFSEHPPPDGRKATKVEPKVTPPSSTPPKEDWKAREQQMRKQRIEKGQKDDYQRAKAHNEMAERTNKCNHARRQLRILSTLVPVYSVNEQGERVYLEDKERAAEVESYRREERANCD